MEQGSRSSTSREEKFAAGLTRLGASCRQEVDDLTLEVYTEALCDQTTPEEWEAFTKAAVRGGRFTWFPKVAELLDALREFRGLPNLDAEAVAAYERVLAAGQYSAEGGTSWEFRAVLRACGKAAAEAFLEAGGHNAFANTYRESDRRERFIAAYRIAAREDDSARLLAPGAVRLIEGAVESSGFMPDEAAALLEKVAGLADEGEENRKPFTKPPVVVEATEDRLALLRAQASQIRQVEA